MIIEELKGSGEVGVIEELEGSGEVGVIEELEGIGEVGVIEELKGSGELGITEELEGSGEVGVIEELKGSGEVGVVEEDKKDHSSPVVIGGEEENSGTVVVEWDAKRVLIGVGARALFYPTLFYNVVRNKIQTEFRWWDRIEEFILLGAVPFPSDVPCLKELGVHGVVTLNEPYETLVPTSLYHAHGIKHLVLPTRDYCFAPSYTDICQAVDFIHENALLKQTTYVHCKAGRGRSTTIVLCYLVQHNHMTPDTAYSYVRSIRPRVLLASAQRQAVQEFYNRKVKTGCFYNMTGVIFKTPRPVLPQKLVPFDDRSLVVITKADLDGYDASIESGVEGSDIWADLSVVYRVRVAGQAALARISCLWFSCRAQRKKSSCSIIADHMGGISVDIHVY